MRLARVVPLALAAAALIVLGTAGATSAATRAKAAGTPIVIGAAIDLTKDMAPFDAPALEAAQIEIKKINAAGGVDGHPLEIKSLNDQLDPTADEGRRARSSSAQGVNIGWVTCDVDYATPAIQEFLAAKLLTVSPCIGTDQMGPSRFGVGRQPRVHVRQPRAGRRRGGGRVRLSAAAGRRPTSSPTSCSCYFQNVCTGLHATASSSSAARSSTPESFTQGDKTINNVATRVNGKKAKVIAFCTSFGSRPAGVRRRPAHARQQDADHQRLGERRRLLVVEEPEDHELLLPHLRGRGRDGSGSGRAARSRRR